MLNPIAPNSAELKEAFRTAGRQLLDSAYDTLVGLDTKIVEAAKQSTDPEFKAAAETLQSTEDTMYEFIEDKNLDITLAPRVIRKEDVKKISPGEHAGVHAQYISNGQTIFINCYGGLRDTKAAVDEHDFGPTLSAGHADRSIDTASKPTFLNIQTIEHNKTEPHVDIWMMFQPHQISLSGFQIEKTRQDVNATIPQSAPEFKVASSVFKSMKNLMSLVHNPYSPPASSKA